MRLLEEWLRMLALGGSWKRDGHSGGLIWTPPRGYDSQIHWNKVRKQLGIRPKERLFAGIQQEGHPGSKVYVDDGKKDEPLRRSLCVRDGKIVHLDEIAASLASGDESLGDAAAVMYVMEAGSNIYRCRAEHEQQELSLALLNEVGGEFVARRLYLNFADEIVSQLPHALWFLPERDIKKWTARE